jgi:hypothetical protein
MAICHSNLKQMGVATQSYSADYQDRLFSFTWKPNSTNGLDPGDPAAVGLLNPGNDYMIASVYQATYIIRKRGDRAAGDFDPPPAWIPHVLYTHLVLQDYLAQRLPEKMVVCPEDRNRLTWQDWRGFDSLLFMPLQPDPRTVGQKRWPYSSSYQPSPCMYDNSLPPYRVVTGGVHNGYLYYPGLTKLGGRKLADVSSPSNKVLLMDEFDRHFHKKQPYYFVPVARQPLLAFDGGVNIHYTRDCNRGGDPNAPMNANSYVSFVYSNAGRPWDPDPLNPNGDTYPAMYRFTRGGLRGVDFGGSEVRPTTAY